MASDLRRTVAKVRKRSLVPRYVTLQIGHCVLYISLIDIHKKLVSLIRASPLYGLTGSRKSCNPHCHRAKL